VSLEALQFKWAILQSEYFSVQFLFINPERNYSMKHSRLTALLTGSALLFCAATFAMADDTKKDKKHDKSAETSTDTKEKRVKVGEQVPNFTMTDVNGKTMQFSDFSGKTVVMEWVNPGCPVCAGITKAGRVTKMIADAKVIDPNVVFVMVNSTGDTANDPQATATYLADNKVVANAAVIDGSGVIGKMFDAKTTPSMFVINSTGNLVYSGAFYDSSDRGETPGKTNYVLNALTQMKAGKAVSPSEVKSYGCGVHYAKKQNG